MAGRPMVLHPLFDAVRATPLRLLYDRMGVFDDPPHVLDAVLDLLLLVPARFARALRDFRLIAVHLLQFWLVQLGLMEAVVDSEALALREHMGYGAALGAPPCEDLRLALVNRHDSTLSIQ